jgi:hypothetical protein
VKAIFVASLILICAGPAEAGTVYGRGTDSCGTWVSAHGPSEGLDGLSENNWLGGYISGINSSGAFKKDVGGDTDLEGLKGWITNYCRAHPLENVFHAANELTIYILTRK